MTCVSQGAAVGGRNFRKAQQVFNIAFNHGHLPSAFALGMVSGECYWRASGWGRWVYFRVTALSSVLHPRLASLANHGRWTGGTSDVPPPAG